jgi:hypothetical protein
MGGIFSFLAKESVMAVFRLLILMLTAALFAASIGLAQVTDESSEESEAKRPANLRPANLSPQDQLDEILTEYEREYSRLRMKMYSSREPDARKEATDELAELRESCVDKIQTIAKENPKTPVALKALESILYPLRADSKETQQWVKERLLEDHANDKALVPIVVILARDEAFIDKLTEKTENRDIRGVILYYRMQMAKGRELTEQNEAAVRPMMERISAEFKDVELVYPGGRVRGRLGDLVENELFAFENLRIGKVAPEIEGVDVHDRSLRLSDFRGKVVVLDFWGHW